MMMGWWDPHYTWFVMVPALLLGLGAQMMVMAAYAKAKRIRTRRGMTGAEVAQAMLRREGLDAELAGRSARGGDPFGVEPEPAPARGGNPRSVRIEAIDGFLSDHYDPARRVLRLSPDNYAGDSIAAAAISAHEAGHALQHKHGYLPLALRTGIVPLVSVGQMIAPIAVMAGLFAFGGPKGWVFHVGVLGYALMVAFALVTLPVEFNASRRAYAALTEKGLIAADEAPVVRQVLIAAALTYVAAAVGSILHLLYLLSLANRSRDD